MDSSQLCEVQECHISQGVVMQLWVQVAHLFCTPDACTIRIQGQTQHAKGSQESWKQTRKLHARPGSRTKKAVHKCA